MTWICRCEYCGNQATEQMIKVVTSGGICSRYSTGQPIPSGSGTMYQGIACKDCAEKWQKASTLWANHQAKEVGKCPDCGAPIYGPTDRPDGAAFMSGDAYFVKLHTVYSCVCRLKPKVGAEELGKMSKIVEELDKQLKGIQRIEVKPADDGKKWWQRVWGKS